jgi:hypothetical protein
MKEAANRGGPQSDEAAFVKKDAFKFGFIGALIVFAVTTILAKTGLAASLGEDEDILFFLQIVSLLASIVSAVGLTLIS